MGLEVSRIQVAAFSRPLPTTTPDGLQIVHNTDLYKKFDAFEQEFSNFQSILTQAQTQRQTLLTQLQTVTSTPAGTEAEQSEKIARINALSAQLHANDEVIRDANEQRQAQQEANTQDSEKQSQASRTHSIPSSSKTSRRPTSRPTPRSLPSSTKSRIHSCPSP